MRLLKFNAHDELVLTKNEATPPGPYAILSHTWGEDEDEITFDDIEKKTAKNKAGYAKLLFCANKAKDHGIEYCWVDTCCIKKSDRTELNEAITSMYKWYKYPSDHPHTTKALQGEISKFDIVERMSWAEKRETTRPEDAIYCLFGLVDIFMTPRYGEERHRAQARFHRKIQMASKPGDLATRLDLSAPGDQATHLHGIGEANDSRNSSHLATGRDTLDYEEFLKSLSYPEMMYRYHDVDTVQGDTCRWLLDHRCYKNWNNHADSNVLLMIRGKPGSGKSTAMKRAYTRAKETVRPDQAVLAFFFNSRGVSMETKLEGLFRSMLHQFFQSHRNDDSEVIADWKQKPRSVRLGWVWRVQELQSIFKKAILSSNAAITMFVDALDECESTAAARDLMKLLSTLAESQTPGSCQTRLKICVSSRHYPNIGVTEPLQITVETANEPDIMNFIKKGLRLLPLESEGLSKRITSRSQGIFLWAFLVLDKIREAIDDGEPRARLHEIIDLVPQRLEELFQELIESIPEEERERCKLVIWWVLFAKRPLRLAELRDALAFREGYSTYEQYQSSNTFIQPAQLRRQLGKCTRGLVEAVGTQKLDRLTDEQMANCRVQFIHESVREYILARRALPDPGSVARWSASGPAHNATTLSCFNYIKAVSTEPGAFTYDTRSDYFPHHEINKPGRAFLDYATRFGLEHARIAELSGSPQLSLLERNTSAASGHARWWEFFTAIFAKHQERGHWSRSIASQLAYACAFGLDSWIERLLTSKGPSPSKNDLSEALCVVATTGNKKRLNLLIMSGAEVNYNKPSLGSPLTLSMLHGHDHFVPILLARGASVRKGVQERSPVVTATRYSSLSSLRLILDRNASVTELEQGDRHALQAAATREFPFMEALLDAAEHQKVPFDYYMTAHRSATFYQQARHAKALESAIMRLFKDRSFLCFYIKTLNGKTIELGMLAETRIYDVKKLLSDKEGPKPEFIFLSNGSRILRDNETLDGCKIERGMTIYMLMRMRWGGRNSGG